MVCLWGMALKKIEKEVPEDGFRQKISAFASPYICASPFSVSLGNLDKIASEIKGNFHLHYFCICIFFASQFFRGPHMHLFPPPCSRPDRWTGRSCDTASERGPGPSRLTSRATGVGSGGGPSAGRPSGARPARSLARPWPQCPGSPRTPSRGSLRGRGRNRADPPFVPCYARGLGMC